MERERNKGKGKRKSKREIFAIILLNFFPRRLMVTASGTKRKTALCNIIKEKQENRFRKVMEDFYAFSTDKI